MSESKHKIGDKVFTESNMEDLVNGRLKSIVPFVKTIAGVQEVQVMGKDLQSNETVRSYLTANTGWIQEDKLCPATEIKQVAIKILMDRILKILAMES